MHIIRIIWFTSFLCLLSGQTTGKISGRVVSKKTQEALPGANVYIEGSSYGTATDNDGLFVLINIPPGKYGIKVDMIGFKTIKSDNVLVSVNRTTSLTFDMEETVIEGEVVTVEVSRLSQKKDLTGTIKNISGDDIDDLVVESIQNVINMQAGIVNGSFRGGRNTEVTYMIDGVQVDDTFGGTSAAVDVQPEAVQDLEVITGTFNAEYGRAMSGVVNIVTKDGGSKFEGSASSGNSFYSTSNDDIFIGLSSSLNKKTDIKFNFGGPILSDKITFFTNVRTQEHFGHLNGKRYFRVYDVNGFWLSDSTNWFSTKSGDSAFVPMNTGKYLSTMAKLSFNIFKGIRFSTMYSFSDDNWFDYSHAFKYAPDGRAGNHKTTNYGAFKLNHMITPKFFYELKLSYVDNLFGTYLYENPTDSRYIHDFHLNNYGSGFFTGGQSKDHSVRRMIDRTIKIDFNWQATNRHSLKLGYLGISHDVNQKNRSIRNLYEGQSTEDPLEYEPVVYPDSTVYSDIYNVKPTELSFYVQDKMEFDNMVFNLGLRYDQFDPANVYPSDRRNPANQLTLPDSMTSAYLDAPKISQISPRFGFAYQLGDKAVLHFSYGHFLQMPPLSAMYENQSFLVGPNDYGTVMGNVLLEPEKTITYEIGLWQELISGLSVDVALYYRDIYNLLSGKVISTYNQIEYGLFSNKDYGNVRGLEVKLEMGRGLVRGMVNYTLQYTKGNADTPWQTFNRQGDSMDPVNRFIPMSWDQRHTINGTVIYSYENFGTTLTAFYNSGSPYTFSPQSESVLSRINLYPNNAYRPSTTTVDASFYYKFKLLGRFNAKIDLNIYNLLDRLNENSVNSETGRAYTAVIRDSDRALHRSDFNDFEDLIENPSMFNAPREIKLILGINF